MKQCLYVVVCVVASMVLGDVAHAQRLEVPRRHDRPPGPPVSAEEAVARMTVPDGFSVEIVAAEPDVVNPVAMCIDERGRYWITESLEYPRREPGPGRDRVKVLEDTDGDGRVDKVTVFAKGLNIPSGIAVGYGGVWVANSPDILFLQDTDGDLKADKTEVIVTGFGRTDTHELPNSFTWGPDGWLYGLNGVFNHSHVKYAESNPNFDPKHLGWQFTCAMFRIHPRTREFQVFAEGTSNPWGIAINDEGDFFISACVIDHLWHIVETGYYIRQGGPYPPHTWPMRSIVEHKHQKAAYCGITWFDSDCYPEEYRKVLYMGNIHGGCINADVIERSGSTYKGKPHPGFNPKPGAWDGDEYGTIAKTGDEQKPKLADLLTANDPWFMPVVQTTGPDGCLYILDWYDRYHCYQDANADPAGIERERGRLYRLVYKGHRNRQADDLSQKSDDELVALLDGPNEYVRQTARRLLAERLSENPGEAIIRQLEARLFDESEQTTTASRLQSLWTLASAGLITAQHVDFDEEAPAELKSWGIQVACDQLNPSDYFEGWGWLRALEAAPEVKLRHLVGISKMDTSVVTKAGLLLMAVGSGKVDPLIRHVGWQNLVPLVNSDPSEVLEVAAQTLMQKDSLTDPATQVELLPRLAAAACTNQNTSIETLALFLDTVLQEQKVAGATKERVVGAISGALRQRSLSDAQVAALKAAVLPGVAKTSAGAEGTLLHQLTVLRALLGEEHARSALQHTFADTGSGHDARMEALETLVASGDDSVTRTVATLIGSEATDVRLRESIVAVLGQVSEPAVADVLLMNFDSFEPNLKPKAIEVLTQRPEWSLTLLKAIQAKEIDKDALNLNQIKRVALFKNDDVQKLVAETYGAVRQEGRSDRQHVINFHRDFLNGTPGDAERGIAAFKKVCGQCHKLHGDGAEVGPDITLNGRNNWEQLLQNVFDPSAVIGPGYQARVLLTADGRVLTGLAVEESDQRVVLKIQGGKLETVPRDQIEEYVVSGVSMMPEDLEKQLTPQEIADLFAYLALDRPPTDPEARLLPGAPQPQR
jgi:putative membrane-bound dehydrogenase-like protein